MHICERAFFHRIESCILPTYRLFEIARDTQPALNTTVCLLYDKDGFLSKGRVELFQTSLPEHVVVIPYTVQRSSSYNDCYLSFKVADRSICFNTKEDAEVISSVDSCNGTCVVTDMPHIVEDIQEDFAHTWGPFNKRARDTVVLIVRPHGANRKDSRAFEDLPALKAMLEPEFNLKIYDGSNPSLTKETAELFASAKVVLGYHGAGFTNLIYSHTASSTVAIELFSRGCTYKQYFNKRMARWGFTWKQLVVGDYIDAVVGKNNVTECKWVQRVAYNQTDLEMILHEVREGF
jgi:hypothetical protein